MTDATLTTTAASLLDDVRGGVTFARVSRLICILRHHPDARLVECADEYTGRRYGLAACRRGRSAKVGSGGRNRGQIGYQIWAVWA